MCHINFVAEETESNTFLMVMIIMMFNGIVLFYFFFGRNTRRISYSNITFSSEKQLQLYKISPNDLFV